MIQKLSRCLRPRLALLLVAALLAAMVPNLSLTAAADAPTSTWEARTDVYVYGYKFEEKETTLTEYTYYNATTGAAEPVTVDHSKDLGEKENPISISSAADLILFGQQSYEDTAGKYYILDKSDGTYDMDGENYSMLSLFASLKSNGSTMEKYSDFEGVLIGNNATITNVYIRGTDSGYLTSPGLFGTLYGTSEDPCQIMDLAVELTIGSVSSTDYTYVGGLAAESYGTVSLNNVTVDVTVSDGGTEYTYFGGLVGYSDYGDSGNDVNISNCTVISSISENATVGYYGGLIGYVTDVVSVTVTDCAVEAGDIQATYYAGGLVGGAGGSPKVKAKNCSVIVKGGIVASDLYWGCAGGLVGYAGYNTDTEADNCTVIAGSILAVSSSDGYAGTLLGCASFANSVTFTNCTVDTVLTSNSSGAYWPTAAVGYVDYYNTAPTFTYSNTISTIQLGSSSSVYVALVNDTVLNSVVTTSDVITASVSASGNSTTGSASVSSDGNAAINVCDGATTYTLSNVTGVIQLEDNTSDTTPAYWVTLDASFTDASNTLNMGDSVNLLSANDIQYTVYFYDPISNSYVDSQTVASGSTVAAPTDPTEDGYEFQGWCTDENYTSSYVFTTSVTKSFTLYAKFAAISAITVDSAITHGTVTVADNATSATEGDTVKITVTSAENYELLTLTVTDEDGGTVSTADGGSGTYTFTMPGSAVTIAATFKNTTSYTITIPSGVTADVETALEGDTVTLTVADSSTVRSLTVTDGDGNDVEVTPAENNTYTFTMPAADVTVSATFQDLTYYNITVPDGVTADPTTAQAGVTVTLTVDTSSYTVNSLTVTDGNSGNMTVTQAGAGTYTFTMPASSVTVNANLSAIVSVDSNITTTAADGDTVTNAPDTSSAASDAEKRAIEDAATEIKVSTTTDGSLAQAVSGESLSEISAAVQDTAEYQTETANASNSEITIHVETALSVTVNGAEVEESSSTVTAVAVEISPVYTVSVFVSGILVATFENPADLINIDLDVDGTVTIQMTVPGVLRCADGDTLYIQHKGYEYSAKVEDGSITFDNPHGFSQFILSTTSKAAVQDENGTTYTSLQAAVNNADSGDTITVTDASGESLTATAKKTITIYNATTAAITVTINGKSYTIAAGGTKTISYRSSSSSSSDSDDPATYSITMEDDTKNGTITLSATEASAGDTVTITVTPDQYYALASLTVTNSKGRAITVTDNGDGTYSFTMPASQVIIEATFEMDEDFLLFLEILAGAAAAQNDCPCAGYTDLDTSAWYHDAVDYVLENGLMTGTSATTFEPNTVTTRGMIATILYRLEGEPTVTGTSGFTDVVDGEWYADAVTWAAQNGIVNGYGNGCFGPYDVITREQMATILYNYAQAKGFDVSVGASTNILSYTDALEISEWAMEAMQWANGAGLITGTTTSTLAPQDYSTRAVMATILMRFCENVVQG